MTVVDTRDVLLIHSKEIDEVFDLLGNEKFDSAQKQLLQQNLNERIVRLLDIVYQGYNETAYLPAPQWLTENAVKIRKWLLSEYLSDETKTILQGSLAYQHRHPGKIPPFKKLEKNTSQDVGDAIITGLTFVEFLAFFADLVFFD